jgi:ribosomal protein S18 acetylase RimI-like enzyme
MDVLTILIMRQGAIGAHPILAAEERRSRQVAAMGAFYGFPESGGEAGHVRIARATRAAEVAAARALMAEYATALGRDLSFQGIDEELAGLPGAYAPPQGALLLAMVKDVPAACVALRPLGEDIAEMKRLYVRSAMRGLGLGELLAKAIIAEAKRLGYRKLRLDTLPEMQAARGLYQRLGFRPIAPYNHNPIPGTAFLELEL